jgi:phosphoglycolate phosphatase
MKKETNSMSGNSIEIINECHGIEIKAALFDFDGTLSLIRAGWQDVMIPMLVEVLKEFAVDETEEQLYEVVCEFVTRLTGKQTIYQMIELCDKIKRRGGEPKDALEYKHMYLDRLHQKIKDKLQGLETGSITPEELLVPGSYELLENLQQRGIPMYLASGTDEPFMKKEAELLDVVKYFGKHIYGALDDYKSFSKAMVIDRIIKTNKLDGTSLIAFGDGYVEIENCKAVGGIAIGVATDEYTKGKLDEWKRNRLTEAGADAIIADFTQQKELLEYIIDGKQI